jgi:hypothetical protein
MIIYWNTLEKAANDTQTIPQYIASEYVPSVHFARNIYWSSQKEGSGKPDTIPEYISKGAMDMYSKKLNNPEIYFEKSTIETNTKGRAYKSSGQAVANLQNGVPTKIPIDTESFDPGSNINLSTDKFIAPVKGKYLVIGRIHFYNCVVDKIYQVMIYVGGAMVSENIGHASNTADLVISCVDILDLNINDEVEIYGQSDSGDNTVDVWGDTTTASLAVHILSNG